ncbi:MAG TPA: hypothetical protein VFS52_10430 [Steroidobacteraceae bacterium]|jgi:hypothetical protein|nr:hypothetical protein [Steroidobacteraceae bacterium]
MRASRTKLMLIAIAVAFVAIRPAAAAPADTVAALGAFDRRLYVVPSRKLVVVRTGAAARDEHFDEQLWMRLTKVIR